jgi:methionyl-tRNA formyltransferase
MIHILGHNEIVVNLGEYLKLKKINFRVYSNINVPKLGSNFLLINNLSNLKDHLLENVKNDLILSAGSPWILNEKFLKQFEPNGIFNIHGTMLPNDRGGTIVSWLILNRKRLGNALVHKMVSSPDAGPILMYNEFIYPEKCYYPKDYLEVYNLEQLKIAKKLCLLHINNQINLTKINEQPHYLSSYWPRLKSTLNGWIDWNLKGENIELFIRAFDDPYKGAQTVWRGKTIFLKKCFFQKDNNFHPYQYGIIYRICQTKNIKYLAIAVKGGTIYVQCCTNEDGETLFNSINEGDRFVSSDECLTQSKKRTVKTKLGLNSQEDHN